MQLVHVPGFQVHNEHHVQDRKIYSGVSRDTYYIPDNSKSAALHTRKKRTAGLKG